MRHKKDFTAIETQTRYQRRSKYGVKDTLNRAYRIQKRVAKAENKKKKVKFNPLLFVSEYKKRLRLGLHLIKKALLENDSFLTNNIQKLP